MQDTVNFNPICRLNNCCHIRRQLTRKYFCKINETMHLLFEISDIDGEMMMSFATKNSVGKYKQVQLPFDMLSGLGFAELPTSSAALLERIATLTAGVNLTEQGTALTGKLDDSTLFTKDGSKYSLILSEAVTSVVSLSEVSIVINRTKIGAKIVSSAVTSDVVDFPAFGASVLLENFGGTSVAFIPATATVVIPDVCVSDIPAITSIVAIFAGAMGGM